MVETVKRLPTQTEMNQRFYVDVCRAEDLINELAKLSRAVLNKQPAHWHDDDTVNLDDLVRDIEKNGATIAAGNFARATSEPHHG